MPHRTFPARLPRTRASVSGAWGLVPWLLGPEHARAHVPRTPALSHALTHRHCFSYSLADTACRPVMQCLPSWWKRHCRPLSRLCISPTASFAARPAARVLCAVARVSSAVGPRQSRGGGELHTCALRVPCPCVTGFVTPSWRGARGRAAGRGGPVTEDVGRAVVKNLSEDCLRDKVLVGLRDRHRCPR